MTDQIVAMSRERIERGSKSFAGAARLLEPRMRDSAYMFYAWCRHCDDEIDGQELGHASAAAQPADPAAALAILRRKTHAALNGRPDEPVFEALHRVVTLHAIPHRHPLELLDGFAMDVDGRRYQSIDELLEYCYHVAGVVGVIMAMIMGPRDRVALDRASDLGIAFQLTNISRDIVPDALSGRCYLPLDWLADEGLTPETLAVPANRKALHAVTRRLLDTADRYYVSARYGLPHLPLRAAWAVAAARSIYRDIGNIVRRRRDHAWDERAVVSKSRKIADAAYAGLSIGRAHLSGAVRAPRSREGLWTHPELGGVAAVATTARQDQDGARGDNRNEST